MERKVVCHLDRVKPAFVFKDLPIPFLILSLVQNHHRHPVTTKTCKTTKSGRR
ncbi:hypothetical protein TNCV_4411411, partial [Trichonephila clavipes]